MGVMFPAIGKMGELTYTGRRAYYKKILKTFGSFLIAYWPLWESSGTVATDISGNGRDGAYTGVDLGQTGIGDGKTSPYFDGANDYVNIYTAGLRAAFNGDEGSIMFWLKPDASSWADGFNHYAIGLIGDTGTNNIRLYKTSSPGQFYFRRYGNSTVHTVSLASQSFTNFTPMAFTWSVSNNRVRGYKSGIQQGADVTGLTSWTGQLLSTGCFIGCYSSYTSKLAGYEAHVIFLNREATPAEVLTAATVP